MDAEFFAAKKAKNIGDAAHRRGFLTHLAEKKASQDSSFYCFYIPKSIFGICANFNFFTNHYPKQFLRFLN